MLTDDEIKALRDSSNPRGERYELCTRLLTAEAALTRIKNLVPNHPAGEIAAAALQEPTNAD
jgi:hypothetical protein